MPWNFGDQSCLSLGLGIQATIKKFRKETVYALPNRDSLILVLFIKHLATYLSILEEFRVRNRAQSEVGFELSKRRIRLKTFTRSELACHDCALIAPAHATPS
ncbi:hypothetical protein VTO42DRAFT_6860 [Malbranchea cinnamomea]